MALNNLGIPVERQYIGARYVLKIYENSQNPLSAEWEANTSFEPLTMVTFQNSSYVSKKYVPPTVGNPANNPAYWTITGAYNGQIANLQQQIDSLDLDRRSAHIFESVSDMMASTINFEDGAILAISDTTFFKVVTSANAITKPLANGKYAELLPDDGGFYHISELALSPWTDIYPIINYLFSNGHYYIQIENGNYALSETLLVNDVPTPQIKIIGESKTKTRIKCTKGFLKVAVNSYGFRASQLKNLKIEGTTDAIVGGDYNGIELTWSSADANNMIDYLDFDNLHISYFNNGITLGGRVIWNNFSNMTVIYNKTGLNYNSRTDSSYFNNNVFSNCEFDTNLNYGLYLNCTLKHGVSNVFIGCSIEGNNVGETTASNLAEMVMINIGAKFVSCHFEKATKTANFVVIVPVKCSVSFDGCAFFNYSAHMLTNTESTIVFESSTIINCDESVYGTDTGTTVFIYSHEIV